eukprot:CAMPEP_0205877210 /NCGR_PEP_ID=MMETSP1083-20121108/14203_1 /ASSEMBLY_ACC=CAM_ASM_000430 /TAXON_ID=97485 /ORGANISM="Prymnesium parvum, Strain Texoma1" /LENGTH=98 /DNA_ID=CAMNT_0053240009 /DNA_START=531 /DNA_END=825 /DNA_ORIENTATION=+
MTSGNGVAEEGAPAGVACGTCKSTVVRGNDIVAGGNEENGSRRAQAEGRRVPQAKVQYPGWVVLHAHGAAAETAAETPDETAAETPEPTAAETTDETA